MFQVNQFLIWLFESFQWFQTEILTGSRPGRYLLASLVTNSTHESSPSLSRSAWWNCLMSCFMSSSMLAWPSTFPKMFDLCFKYSSMVSDPSAWKYKIYKFVMIKYSTSFLLHNVVIAINTLDRYFIITRILKYNQNLMLTLTLHSGLIVDVAFAY